MWPVGQKWLETLQLWLVSEVRAERAYGRHSRGGCGERGLVTAEHGVVLRKGRSEGELSSLWASGWQTESLPQKSLLTFYWNSWEIIAQPGLTCTKVAA